MMWLVVVAIAAALPLSVAHAASPLTITEIMYDPAGANTGRQWVEIANTGDQAFDLATKTIRFFAGGANHVIKTNGDSTLAPGAVAVIANNPIAFATDWPSYAGQLFKSSFSLAESGSVGIVDTAGNVLTQVRYDSTMGANNDGNSLQLAQGSDTFKAGAPTPGEWVTSVPAPLAAPAKLSPFSRSTNKQATSKSGTVKKRSSQSRGSGTSKSKAYGNGMTAPAESTEALSAGALPSSFASTFSIPYPPFLAGILSSVWFACYLALVAFSGFLIIVIQRHYPPYPVRS